MTEASASFLARAADRAAAHARRAIVLARQHPWWAAAMLPILLVLYVLVQIPLTPGIGDIRRAREERPAVVLSADGQALAEYRRANRSWVKLADISPHVVSALLATEDRRFYDHHGIDVRRTIGALLHTAQGNLQGGSTITQQLARNLYPDDIGRSVSVTRKVREAITALKIEASYSKDEILETYLNTVPFLYNAFGIEMAARTYFDTSAAKLDVLQSATLVGMLKGTSYYNPVTRPERAQERRNLVLSLMDARGELPDGQLKKLQARPLKIDFERQVEAAGPAPHLARYLRRWLIDWADRNDYDIYADGLRVHTTIDARLQDAANRAVQRQGDVLQRSASAQWGPRAWTANRPVVQAMVRETAAYKAARDAGEDDAHALKQVLADNEVMQALRTDKARLQAGFVAIDPRNGNIRAWVGSRGFDDDQFDHVQQARRQPGSTFKPFVYGAAFAQGIDPNETFMDGDVEIPLGNGQVWRPTDVGASSYQAMTLRDGLALSKNTITAQLVQRIGPASVAQTARALGVRQSKLDEVFSLALGTSPVTLKEMVSAYASIANGGNYVEPIVVTRVEDRNGRVLEAFQNASPEPALEHGADQKLLDAMRGVIDRGTGTSIRSRWGVRGDVAGKTGTTQDNTDGWFILMHPELVAGAWVGFNDSRLTMTDSWGQGARSALPIVGDFVQTALRTKAIDANAVFDAPRAPPPAPPQEVVPEQGTVLPGWGGTPMPQGGEGLPPGTVGERSVAPVEAGNPVAPAVVGAPLAPAPVATAAVPAPQSTTGLRVVPAPARAAEPGVVLAPQAGGAAQAQPVERGVVVPR